MSEILLPQQMMLYVQLVKNSSVYLLQSSAKNHEGFRLTNYPLSVQNSVSRPSTASKSKAELITSHKLSKQTNTIWILILLDFTTDSFSKIMLCVWCFFFSIILNQKRSQTDPLRRTWDHKVLDITVPSAISSVVGFRHDRETTRSRLKCRSPSLLMRRRTNQCGQCSFHQLSFHTADSYDRIRHSRPPHIQSGWRKRHHLTMATATRNVFMKTTPERAWMRGRRAHTSPLDVGYRPIFPGNDNRSIRRTRTIINKKTDRRRKRRRWIHINTAGRCGSSLMIMSGKITMVIVTESGRRRVKAWRWSKRWGRRGQRRRVTESAARWEWPEHRATGSGFRGRRWSHH